MCIPPFVDDTKIYFEKMLKIKNKTIIDHIIAHLYRHNLNEFLICSGYKSAMIEEHFYNIKSIIVNILLEKIKLIYKKLF